MDVIEPVLVILLLAVFVWGVYLIIAALRIPPEEPAASFQSGCLGTFGVMLGLFSGTGLAAVLAAFGVTSVAEVVAAVILNVIFQPIALLLCWTAIRKITLGVCGQIAYAWRRIPEAELVDIPPSERRGLAWACVFQGIVALPFGVCISASLAYPLILWFMR